MKSNEVLDLLKRRFPNEPEYHQAVAEVLTTIEDVYNEHPEFEKSNLIERLCIPDRIDLPFFGKIPGCSQGFPAGYNRNLYQWIGMFKQPAQRSMSCFMECDAAAFFRGSYFGAFLQSPHNPVYRVHEIIFLNETFSATGGYQRGFITDVGNIRSGKTGCLSGEGFRINALIDRTWICA